MSDFDWSKLSKVINKTDLERCVWDLHERLDTLEKVVGAKNLAELAKQLAPTAVGMAVTDKAIAEAKYKHLREGVDAFIEWVRDENSWTGESQRRSGKGLNIPDIHVPDITAKLRDLALIKEGD